MPVFLGGNQNNRINITAFPDSRIDYYMKPKDYNVTPEERKIPIIKDYKNAGSIE